MVVFYYLSASETFCYEKATLYEGGFSLRGTIWLYFTISVHLKSGLIKKGGGIWLEWSCNRGTTAHCECNRVSKIWFCNFLLKFVFPLEIVGFFLNNCFQCLVDRDISDFKLSKFQQQKTF